MWQHHRRDTADGLARYARALRLGNTKPLPELFGAAGLDLGFDEEHVASLIGELSEAMAEIRA